MKPSAREVTLALRRETDRLNSMADAAEARVRFILAAKRFALVVLERYLKIKKIGQC